MIGKQMKNEKGFSLIEMLLAMTLGIVMMGVAVYTFNQQNTVIRTGNQGTETRGMARLALDELVENIQMAGYGMPPGDSKKNDGATPTPAFTPRGAVGIANASAVSVTYRANTDNITTFLAKDTSSTFNSLWVPQNSALTGDPDTAFTVDDQVVFFDVSAPESTGFPRTISTITVATSLGITYDKIALSGVQHGVDLKPIRNSVPVAVNQYHEINYTFDPVAQTITITDDMGTTPTGDDITNRVIATNITNLTFVYFDSFDGMIDVSTPLLWANGAADQAELGKIRGVAINLTVQDQNEPTVTTTLTSGVALRNMGN